MKQLEPKDYARFSSYRLDDSPEEISLSVFEEVKFIQDSNIALLCFEQVRLFFENNNPHHADKLLEIASDHNFIATPTMLEVITIASKKRLNGDPSGTGKEVEKDGVKKATHELISIMVHHGYTLKLACNKAAKWRKDNHPNHLVKASSLETTHKKYYRRETDEEECIREFYEMTEHDWTDAIEALPELDQFDPEENKLVGSNKEKPSNQ